MSSVTLSWHRRYTNTRLADVMKPWSCQPCMRRVRPMFLNQRMTSPQVNSFSLQHLRHMKPPKQRSSSPVDAWITTHLAKRRETLLGCFWTDVIFTSPPPFWDVIFWDVIFWDVMGTVGTRTGMGALGLLSSVAWDFLVFSWLSWETSVVAAGSG